MHRTNTPENVAATGAVQIDAGEGVTFSVPAGGVDLGTIAYDSGMRIINDLAATRTAGTIYLRRTGAMVFVQFTGVVSSDQSSGYTAVTLPVGFRPAVGIWDTSPLHVVRAAPSVEGQVMRTSVGTNGTVRFFAMNNTTPLYFSASYMTDDPPPATLPGTPA